MGIRIQPKELDIPEKDPFKYDLLDRLEVAEALTNIIGNIEGSCTIAVDAAWGFGKTTFLKMWSHYLRNEEFNVISFNVWETDFSKDPFLSISTEIIEGLRKSNLLDNRINELKDASKEVFRWVLLGAIRFSALQAPFINPQLAGEVTAIAEKRFSQHLKAQISIKSFREVLENTATDLSEKNHNLPLIVMIDELDRCRPSYAIELLEVAKHLFLVEHVVFVLAVNCEQLKHSVKALYGNDFDAEGYLRRFFDVDFQLSEPIRKKFIHEQLQTTGIKDYLNEISSNSRNRFKRELSFEDFFEMLSIFFQSSSLSLRSISKSIHRLRALYGSLNINQENYILATTAALILRTLDQNLYKRFIHGEATDLDVMGKIFSLPGLQHQQYNLGIVRFEVAIIFGYLEFNNSRSMTMEINTPLLGQYKAQLKNQNDKIEKLEHARMVINELEKEHSFRRRIGFGKAVKILELVNTRSMGEDSE